MRFVGQGFGMEIAHPALQDARRLALDLKGKLVRPLVPPLDAGLGADDAQLLAMQG